MLMRMAPVLFVVLWSTGYIGSKLGAADAEPFTFLSLRFLIVVALLLPVALYTRAVMRGWLERAHAMIAGALIHGACLGGVFWAIHRGMPAGVSALIVSLQPIATSVLAAALLGERLTARHWLGLPLGLCGALLIIAPKLQSAGALGGGVTITTVTAALISLAGITFGTLYQKRFATGIAILPGAIWQYVGALVVVGIGALLFETRTINWTPRFVIALSWLVLAISIGAVSLLMVMIRRSGVANISGLFYMVPGITAVFAYVLFDERLDLIQMAGLILVSVAVLLIVRTSVASSERRP